MTIVEGRGYFSFVPNTIPTVVGTQKATYSMAFITQQKRKRASQMVDFIYSSFPRQRNKNSNPL